MAIYDNSYTLSYIRITGCIVTYNEEVYTVQNESTNRKYIYWNANNPYKLETSNLMLDRSNTRFLIVINDNGIHTEVPNDSDIFNINYDGDSQKNIEKEIYALYETDKELGDRFISVEKDLDGIRQTVGDVKEYTSYIKENISVIDQKADNINIFVKEATKNFNDSKELSKLREDTNNLIIKLNSDLGLFNSNINEYFRDDEITDIEKAQISTQISLLDTDKSNLHTQIQKIIDRCQSNSDSTSIAAINSSKTALDNAHNNFKTIINSVISDNIITPSDVILVTNGFAKYNLRVNELKNTLDGVFLKGLGGSVSEEFAQINVKANEIALSVKKLDTNVGEMSSEIRLMAGEIASKVSEGDISSIIRQSPTDIRIGFNKIANSVVINSSGLTVNQGAIACDTLMTPSGHEPVINLFNDGSANIALDARSSNGAVKGSAIRLKYNNGNYLFINRYSMNTYIEDEIRLQVNKDDTFIKCGGAKFCFTNDPYSFFPDQDRTDLGQRYNCWRYVYCDEVRTTSDAKFKENIRYINNNKIKSYSKIMDTPFIDFLKNDLKIATFNYKTLHDEDNNQQIGFIANDIQSSKIGKYFIYDYGEKAGLKFSLYGYTTIVAGALQEEIKKREELESITKNLCDKIDKLGG
ncbi:tail fiber domain-containing protein [Clostridioides difficile]|nr:tail fiber domain-containing protein [Clostridioides difficile]